MLGGGITIAGIAADTVGSAASCTSSLRRRQHHASQPNDFAKFIEEPVYSFEHRALFVRA